MRTVRRGLPRERIYIFRGTVKEGGAMRHIESLKRLIEDLSLPWPETYLVGRDVIIEKLKIILAEYDAEAAEKGGKG